MGTLSNPVFYESGVAGASAVVGFESSKNRVVRYDLNLDSAEQASHIRVLFDEDQGTVSIGGGASFFEKINGEMSYYFAISTDPNAFANAGYENIADATGKAVFNLYRGSWQSGDAHYRVECEADVKLYPNTQYYFWVFPGFSNDLYGWVWWGSSLTITVALSGTVAYTVAYDAGGGTDAPEPQNKLHGEDLVLTSAMPTKKGHSFLGWAATADGEVAYQPGGTYTADAAVTLYAVWQVNRYTDTFDPNGGTGGGSFTGDYGESYQAPTASRRLFALTGWWTESSGGSQVTSPGQTVTHDDNNDTLYAQWHRTGYNIACNPCGGVFRGSVGITNLTAQQQAVYSAYIGTAEKAATVGTRTVILDANGGGCQADGLVSNGPVEHTFVGWYDQAGAQVYDENGQCVEGAYWRDGLWVYDNDLQIYAKYSEQPGQFGAVILPSAVRAGYVFRGWSTDPNATEGMQGEYTPLADVTLYAVWGKSGEVPVPRFRVLVNTRGKLRPFRVLAGTEHSVKAFLFHIEPRQRLIGAMDDGAGNVTVYGKVFATDDGNGNVTVHGDIFAADDWTGNVVITTEPRPIYAIAADDGDGNVTVYGELSAADDGNGNVVIAMTANLSATDDGHGGVVIS